MNITEVAELGDDLIEIINSCIQTGDPNILFDAFREENSYINQLDSVYLKINNDISNFCNDLHSTEILVSNVLTLLTEVIRAYGIGENLCFLLARTILFLIIDEYCSINNIKRAIHVLNLLVINKSVISAIVGDDSLEGSLQIFGRKIPLIGDYECQALLYEALYRITCDKNREYWASIWFKDQTARNIFLALDPQKFELNCRAALNYINRNEFDRRVFSVIACSVSFGTFELKQPSGCEFWVDFNYGSQSISFYCSELSVKDSLNDSEYWETILINKASVKSYDIETNKTDDLKEVTLRLNCPCHTLITSSAISNPALNSFEITLIFLGLYDILSQLERVYGREKCLRRLLQNIPKVSDSSVVIKCSNIENGTAEEISAEFFSKRKILDSSPVPIVNDENENIIPETCEVQQIIRISESSEVLKIPEEEHGKIDYETQLPRKIYNSELIPLTPTSEFEKFHDTNLSHQYSENINEEILPRRKVSCSSVNIKIIDNYEHQVADNEGKEKKNLSGFRSKKHTLPANSAFLKTNNNDALMNGTVNNTNDEAQNDSKYNCDKFVEKYPISSITQIKNEHLLTSKYNKISTSQENNDFCSASISDKKEIDIVEKSMTKDLHYNDERTSITSDVFADISLIEDSQNQKPKTTDKSGHYLRNRRKRPSSEPLEFSTASKEKLRRSSMPATYGKSNGLNECIEKDEYEIIPSPRNKISSSSEKSEGREIQSNFGKKQKKRRVRRRSQRIKTMKASAVSETSSSLSDTNINKNWKPLKEKPISTHREQVKMCDTKELTKQNIDSLNIPVNNSISLSKGHTNNSSPDKNLLISNQSNSLNLINRNKFEKLQKEIINGHSVILNENKALEKSLLNEKKCFEENNENNKNKSYFENTSEKENSYISPVSSLENIQDAFKTSINKVTEDAEKVFPSKKLKIHPISDTSPKSKDGHSKDSKNDYDSQPVQKQSGESSKGTSNSDSISKRQSKSKRLYNLDNAPVYDVPPSKLSNKNYQNPKEGQMEYQIADLNTDKQCDFIDNVESDSGRKKDSHVNRNSSQRNLDDRMKIYDDVEGSDKDFEEHTTRDFNRTRKRPRTTMASQKRSSRKKKIEVLQADTTTKSTRTRRKAAFKAMNVNRRILDPTSEVTCDEIEVMGESDDSQKETDQKPEKKRKYPKVFVNSHTDTETVSSEVSWMKKKSRLLFESPKKNYANRRKNQLKKKSLPVEVVSVSKPTYEKLHHSISAETGSKSKSMNWSDLENFNLTVEKSTRKSYPFLQALENDLKSLSNISRDRIIDNKKKSSSVHSSVHSNNNKKSKDASGEINSHDEYASNNNFDNICDNVQSNDSIERHNLKNYIDIPQCDEDVHEMKRTRKQNQSSNNNDVAESSNVLKLTSPPPQSSESHDSLHKERGSDSNNSLLLENEYTSEYAAEENICMTDIQNETKGKELHLQRFLEHAVKFSESCLDSDKSFSLPNLHSSLDHSKDNSESVAKPGIVPMKVRRSKTIELPVSWTRQKIEKHESATNTDILQNYPGKDLVKEDSNHLSDATLDDLCLRNSDNSVYKKAKNVSCELVDKKKRKHADFSAEKEIFEKQQKRSKLHDNSALLKNCTIDSLRPSSGPSGSKRSSKIMDNGRSRLSRDFGNNVLNRSGSHSKKTTIKTNSILDNSLHSRLTPISLKDIEMDKTWFKKITFMLSQDSDAMTRRLLATVQKCFYEYSAKMCMLREKILKAAEVFEMSSVHNVKTSKLKNLIQMCGVIRLEVEKSLKAMQMTSKEYFEAEEKNYRKLKRKYMKAIKKYMLSMKSVKRNAVHKLEGNVILKAKYFFRKFLKYIDSA